MSLGGSVLKQHVVEFIANTTTGGIWTDGVRDSTSLSGPWTWIVPQNVTQLTTIVVSGGGGGGGGYNTGTSLSGGGGGASGIALSNATFAVKPNASLIVTIGAGGSAGALGGLGGNGGATTIEGLLNAQFGSIFSGKVVIGGMLNAGSPGLVGAGGAGGQLGNGGSPGSGGLTQASPTNGGNSPANWNVWGLSAQPNPMFYGGMFSGSAGGGGGGASTTVTTSGASGGAPSGGGSLSNLTLGANLNGASGANTGTISIGGGGPGGSSAFGRYGPGGAATSAGGAPGSDGVGYGSGGGGGSGGAVGGAGTNGYVCFTYWSQD